ERVLAEWVADGEAVVIRAADYPAFATARDLIERYRAALPPEPPSTEALLGGAAELPSSPLPGYRPPTPDPVWDVPAPSPLAPDPLLGSPSSAPSPPWQEPPQPPAASQPWDTPAPRAPAPDPSGGPTVPEGLPGSDAAREMLSAYPEPVRQFARDHPEAVQEFLSNPQQFMREHPEVVREFMLAQRAQRMSASGGGAGSVSGMQSSGGSATTAGARPQRSGRSRASGCLLAIVLIAALVLAREGSRAVTYVKSHLTLAAPTSLSRPGGSGVADQLVLPPTAVNRQEG
ncbi:MAG TPA: hypothetical protein VFN57_17990, partial [Thermomicrobiaceae bacterium]|nr:hypothetical protein [Thermomicrobiaceae bacterium]